jgi:S-adenosylmethionine synthetase, C-terminal domain
VGWSGECRAAGTDPVDAIGVARPVSVFLETFGTEQVDPAKLEKLIPEFFDLRPAAILRDLDLRRPIYRKTAAYGHFGRSDTDRAEDLAKAATTSSAPQRRRGGRAVSQPAQDATAAAGAPSSERPPPGSRQVSGPTARTRFQPAPTGPPSSTREGGSAPPGRP